MRPNEFIWLQLGTPSLFVFIFFSSLTEVLIIEFMKKKGKNDVAFWFDLILLKPQKTFRCDGVDDCGGGDDGDNNDDVFRINIILFSSTFKKKNL